jgi:hypothetical protein
MFYHIWEAINKNGNGSIYFIKVISNGKKIKRIMHYGQISCSICAGRQPERGNCQENMNSLFRGRVFCIEHIVKVLGWR